VYPYEALATGTPSSTLLTYPTSLPTFSLLILGFEVITVFDNVSFLRFLRTFEKFVLGRSTTLGLGFLHSSGPIRVSSGRCEEAENKSPPSLSRPRPAY